MNQHRLGIHSYTSNAVQVPERPKLAPSVQLVGPLQGSGFENPQWLIQRNGRFIQLSELLYRVAEQANGEQTLEEIASRLTQSTDRTITEDHVSKLIQKLMPLGLIATSEGPITSTTQGVGPSPLALNMRVKVLNPRIIDPFIRILQFLYAPPVLLLLLALTGIGHAWLYSAHSVTDSILYVLNTPGLLLAALAVMAVAGMFHELGHASALRYGGGKVRGMGVGLYLIYPAFYTDTTDAYRLGRWGRVRTDLGGLYFHLLFALGLIVLYLVTGQEFLIFIVLLINLDIVYQSLPFVRLDGYWALSDLTGIPDFLSQAGPFVASLLPHNRHRGMRLPSLKPWVEMVFIAYLAVTVPVLVLLSLAMVVRLPRFLWVIRDAFVHQMEAFSSAYARGDLLVMGASASQMLILLIPMLGLAYLFYSIGRRLLWVLWRWSKPTMLRWLTH